MNHSAIYVSSSCVNHRKIKDSVIALVEQGFRNIELSGGTHAYDHMEQDLIALKQQHQLSYRCHNYFPPPVSHFVLNLSSSDPVARGIAIKHIQSAIELSERLEAKKLGIHAGFRMQPKVTELGQAISKSQLLDEAVAIQLFVEAWLELSQQAKAAGVELYIENNVLSAANSKTFAANPFLATDHASIKHLLVLTQSKLLLDVAHLKVSCHSLGFNFSEQLTALIQCSDYIHLSDNNGLADTNKGLQPDSELLDILSHVSLQGKTFTLEVYDGAPSLSHSYQLIDSLLEQQL